MPNERIPRVFRFLFPPSINSSRRQPLLPFSTFFRGALPRGGGGGGGGGGGKRESKTDNTFAAE